MKVNGPRALIQRLDAQDVVSQIIEVVRYEAPPSQIAFVIAAGNGERLPSGKRRPLDFKSGDVVVTKPYCGSPTPYTTPDGEEIEAYMVMEEDVLAVIEGM